MSLMTTDTPQNTGGPTRKGMKTYLCRAEGPEYLIPWISYLSPVLNNKVKKKIDTFAPMVRTWSVLPMPTSDQGTSDQDAKDRFRRCCFTEHDEVEPLSRSDMPRFSDTLVSCCSVCCFSL